MAVVGEVRWTASRSQHSRKCAKSCSDKKVTSLFIFSRSDDVAGTCGTVCMHRLRSRSYAFAAAFVAVAAVTCAFTLCVFTQTSRRHKPLDTSRRTISSDPLSHRSTRRAFGHRL